MECVKLLIANHLGVDKNGNRCSALTLQSNLGYTALHLCALDCPPWSVREISYLLLLIFEDYSTKCSDGRTAIEIAHDERNDVFIDQYNRFTAENIDEVLKERISHSRHVLASAKYTFRMPDIPKRVKTKFSLPQDTPMTEHLEPNTIRRSQRMPPKALIPENELLPLVSYGNSGLRGAKALKCMKFAISEAEKNRDRRVDLVRTFDDTVEALDVSKYVK